MHLWKKNEPDRKRRFWVCRLQISTNSRTNFLSVLPFRNTISYVRAINSLFNLLVFIYEFSKIVNIWSYAAPLVNFTTESKRVIHNISIHLFTFCKIINKKKWRTWQISVRHSRKPCAITAHSRNFCASYMKSVRQGARKIYPCTYKK